MQTRTPHHHPNPGRPLLDSLWWKDLILTNPWPDFAELSLPRQSKVSRQKQYIEWMGRAVLVEVNHEVYSNLLKLTKIGDMPVVSAHRSLNFCKGVVRFKQAATDLTNEDLVRDLNVLAQQRLTSSDRGTQGHHQQGWQEGTNRYIFPHLWCPSPAKTHLPWVWTIRRGTVHPCTPMVIKVPTIWPRSPYLPGCWGSVSNTIKDRPHSEWVPKQGVPEVPKLWRCPLCCKQGMPSFHHRERSTPHTSWDTLPTSWGPNTKPRDPPQSGSVTHSCQLRNQQNSLGCGGIRTSPSKSTSVH